MKTEKELRSAPGAAETLIENSPCGYPTFDVEKGYYTAFGQKLNRPEQIIDAVVAGVAKLDEKSAALAAAKKGA